MSRYHVSLAALLLAVPLFAQTRPERWIALLEAPALAETTSSREALHSPAAEPNRQRILGDQARLRRALAEMPVHVTGASHILVNAIYFSASREEADRVRTLPGVTRVVRSRPYRPAATDASTAIVNAPAAWSVVGGESNAGAGRRIGVIDSGIDQAHPSFQDDSLTPPPGFPRANTDSDLAFTNRKVIVARSYVPQVADAGNPIRSRPDDNSARDRTGHGTAVAAIAAGRRVEGPAATIVGVAPKAFLGNYKVFGSPGVNDGTFTGVLITALEDAIVDGMDVVTLSVESPAAWGPLDRLCGPTDNQPCDVLALAINGLSRMNVAVVAAAGNFGNDGFNFPSLGSIASPGTAPDAITVGAITNGNIYLQRLRMNDGGTITNFVTLFGNGPLTAVQANATYVAQIGVDGFACRPLGNNTLAGRIAIIDRGDCSHLDKVNNAQRAGAVGVVMVQFAGNNAVFRMDDVARTGIPAVLIGSNDGATLKQRLNANPSLVLTFDNTFRQEDAAADEIEVTSSQGPAMFSLVSNSPFIKPELTAVGTDIYTAVQRYDPNGSEYSPDGYLALNGTSFAVPMVAGAVAMVKQRRPDWTPTRLKSAVVNTANPNVTDFDQNGVPFRARVNSTGAGKLDAGQAVNAVMTADPTTVSFGVIAAPGVTRDLRLTNTTNANIQVRIDIEQRDADSRGRVTIDQGTQFGLPQGQTTQLTVRLSGLLPSPGNYEGVIVINGSGPAIRVPYQYLVGDGVPFNIYPLGNDFVTIPNVLFRDLLFRITDRYGVPVRNAPMQWSSVRGGGRIDEASRETDSYGVGFADVVLGPEVGEQVFRVQVAGLEQFFYFRTIQQPTIFSNGIVDAASGRVGQGLAPGSYISIFGSGLSPVTQAFATPYLPVSLTGVSVSFDVESQRIGAPGRLHFVSNGQVNVQIPWEMRNFTTAQMKVSIGDVSSAIFNVPLNEFSPGIFEYSDASSGRLLAAALDETNVVISGSNPVERGRVAQLYVNGLGRVANPVASGEPASLAELNPTVATPEVRIGGQIAPVRFSGLAPGFVGLYQVNVQVPAGAPTGFQPLTISLGGVTSQTSQLNLR
jgi:minor extracellular serine protease Vpr